MLSESFRPRFHIKPSFLLPSSETNLVPLREVTQKRPSPGAPCNQAISPLPLFNPNLDPNLYCTDFASSKLLEADISSIGSIQKMSDLNTPSDIQVGYLSLPAKFPSDYFTNPNSQIPRSIDSLKPKRIQFLRFIPYPDQPNRVKFIEVQAGGTIANILYPEPAFVTTPLCQVATNATPDSQCQSLFPGAPCTSSNSASFSLVNTGGVVISASFDGVPLNDNEIPQQTVQAEKNELLKTLSISDLKGRMQNTQQEPNSDYAQGLVRVSGEVRGPDMSRAPTQCQSSVAVRFYRPLPPQCTIALTPEQQEPDLPVTATVKVKNQTTSAVLVSNAGGGANNLSLNPAPSVTQEITTTPQILKQGDNDELITVNLQGPGGSGSCQASLKFLRPAPPQCNLTANPPSTSACNPNTTLTLDCVNRVHSASINGVPVTLNAQGRASIPYTKSGRSNVTITAEARNRWWANPSTPHVTIGDNTDPPTCKLTASTSDVMVGQSTTLTLSNVQGCFNANQIDINGSPVSLSGGQASLSYTKQNTNAETLVAHIRGPERLLGTCPVPLTGYPIPKPTCTLSAGKTTLAFGESTTLSLSHEGQVTDGEVYINGHRGATHTYTKNSCGPQTITGYVVGPGGQSDCPSITIQHNTPTPSCTFAATPTEGLQTGASVTATLSCSQGQYVKSAVLFDENRTNDIKSSGSAPRTLANLTAGTHNVRALVHDACDRQILDQNIPLNVATPPPACPFMAAFLKPTDTEKAQMKALETRVMANERYSNFSSTEMNNFKSQVDKGEEPFTSFQMGGRVKPGVQTDFDSCQENNAAGNGWINCKQSFDFRSYELGTALQVYVANKSTWRLGQWPHHWVPNLTNPDEYVHPKWSCKKSENRICIHQKNVYNWIVRKPATGAYPLFVGIKDTHLASCRISDVIARDLAGCFTADTPITMANGKEKLISEIRENEYVFNPHYRTGIRVRKVVKGPEPKPLFEVALNGKKIKVTEDHPFFTERGWVQTLALEKGDKLFGEGKGKVVESVRKLPYQKPVDVWNFELDTEDPLAHIVMAN